MEWTGRCLCGAVRYRATEDPIRAVNCHCGMCRRLSGAAFLTHVHFRIGAFTWTKGKPTRYHSMKLFRALHSSKRTAMAPAVLKSSSSDSR